MGPSGADNCEHFHELLQLPCMGGFGSIKLYLPDSLPSSSVWTAQHNLNSGKMWRWQLGKGPPLPPEEEQTAPEGRCTLMKVT